MKVFQHFNQENNSICPICGTNDDKETALIPIAGTKDGNLSEYEQVHLECISPTLFFESGKIAHIIHSFISRKV